MLLAFWLHADVSTWRKGFPLVFLAVDADAAPTGKQLICARYFTTRSQLSVD